MTFKAMFNIMLTQNHVLTYRDFGQSFPQKSDNQGPSCVYLPFCETQNGANWRFLHEINIQSRALHAYIEQIYSPKAFPLLEAARMAPKYSKVNIPASWAGKRADLHRVQAYLCRS